MINEIKKITAEYKLTPRPTSLKEACLQTIEKWEKIINIVIIYDYKWEPTEYLNSSSCGLCRFLYVKNGHHDEFCNICVLDNCGYLKSSWKKAVQSNDNHGFVTGAYKLIKRIRKQYKKKTGEILPSV